MRRFVVLALTMLIASGLTACGRQAETPATRQIIAMDTAMTFTVYGEYGNEVVQAAVEEVHRLERMLDRTDRSSEVGLLNQVNEVFSEFGSQQTVKVGDEVCRLIETARTYSQATGGAFDITIAPVVSAWGFTEAEYRLPPQTELDKLLAYVGMEHVHTDDAGGAWLDRGTQIDLGGIAKGYASDCLADIFQQYQVEQGWASLGGNVLACGTRPDGHPWKVGIQDPKYAGEERFVGMIGLEDAYAVTSGGYQRYFEEDGETYHHIIDPSTGYPADSGVTSVTVVADSKIPGNGTMCDALSTALFVMGEERALEFWRSSGFSFDLVLVTEDDCVLVTSGIAEQFTETEGSGYTYETVS